MVHADFICLSLAGECDKAPPCSRLGQAPSVLLGRAATPLQLGHGVGPASTALLLGQMWDAPGQAAQSHKHTKKCFADPGTGMYKGAGVTARWPSLHLVTYVERMWGCCLWIAMELLF